MEGLVDYVDYSDYTPGNETAEPSGTLGDNTSFWKYSSLIINILIALVGLSGNSVVIWISGWKMKRSVNSTFYLSLAISDFLFCACLPMEIFYVMTSNWPFGLALCKLTSSALFFNMFSSVFVLMLISIDRCVIAMFPAWSQNHRTIKMASSVLVITWILSATMTLPSLLHRNTRVLGNVTQCYVHSGSIAVGKAVVLTRFIFGFLIPFVIIVSCSIILCIKLRRLTIKTTKPYKVMVILILTFFICWIPFHIFVLLELNIHKHNVYVVETGLVVAVTLAAANSLINPFLYVFIGKEFKQTLRKSIIGRMEYAMDEDVRTASILQGSKSMANDGQISKVFVHNVL
ncbi:chemokine-like receptor 1 [Gadus morhua]|uniref:chemokine-like receptor 1 n=1 Tax=Gadus morhua TaxID=8049 RepID=UPI0011B7744B|nr:chemokine-like receptor 1 [Gadus morhua]